MKKMLALVAGAALAVSGAAQANDGPFTLTFDLSNYTVTGGQVVFGTANGLPGTVTSVKWNFNYTAGSAVGSASWASELAVELIAPGSTPNAVTASNFPSAADTGYWVAPGNAGTFVWGSPNQWAPAFTPGSNPATSHNLGWGNTTGAFNSSGGTTALNGASTGGTWTLRIFDSYLDAPAQGRFGDGSYVSINYIPAPGALALLGVAGLVGSRRRRD